AASAVEAPVTIFQYTRNMVTGASTADAALILIDARNGVTEQTFRHTFIATLLQIKHIIVCVNKMDLVNYEQAVFEDIKEKFFQFTQRFDIHEVIFVPISALVGDNVVTHGDNTSWYKGRTLLEVLETINLVSDHDFENKRMPVQYVIRPQRKEFHDFRGYAGRISGGIFKSGDAVKILPSGLNTRIKTIELLGQPIDEAFPPMSVTMTLEDDIDISRGDMIVGVENGPQIKNEVDLMICWMGDKPMQLGGKYSIMHTTKDARCIIKDVKFKVNVNTLEQITDDKQVSMNEIAQISIKTTQPLLLDSYKKNRKTGALILIEEGTNNTVGVGMIL
ncbi:MAG: sulfate adenylyltransferase, partial [Bacteroidales bacterium]|nr:sulfate adenylyltransferase [Bacteroidales bacterium]